MDNLTQEQMAAAMGSIARGDLKTSIGPMGREITIPQMDKMDWDALQFLDGPGGFGKEWPHPDWHFGVLNKFSNDCGWKLRSGKYFAITEEIDKKLQEEYGIYLSPRDDPAYDEQGRLHFRECIWFYMTHEFKKSLDKVHLLKSLGHAPQAQRQADQWVSGQLARTGGRFNEKDLQVKVEETYAAERHVSETPISEKEKSIGSSFDSPEKNVIGI